ncbi:MAG: type IX secretion system sortase PorU [Muribaculaceae bacterium]|nr:type IX secretion system sortase PorU [Muribaculaceae bacterium]
MDNSIRKYIIFIITALYCVAESFAFNTSYYAQNSYLASGKWVKIKVSKTGITQISFDELTSFGFSNPENVKIYGYGGTILNETLSTSMPDDLTQVATLKYNNKIFFYAVAAKNMTITALASSTPRFTPLLNTYSIDGYYFLTDINVTDLDVAQVNNTNSGTNIRKSGIGYDYHELELTNIATSGRTFLGEDLVSTGFAEFDMNLPYIVENSKINLSLATATSATSDVTISAYYNNDNIPFDINTNIVKHTNDVYENFVLKSPSAIFTPNSYSENGKLKIKVESSGQIKVAKLDFATLTYDKQNSILNSNQTDIYIHKATNKDKVSILCNDENILVWGVDNINVPAQYLLEFAPSGAYKEATFSPNIISNCTKFIAFNPLSEQNHIEFVKNVENQNLHAMPVPDMIIIANAALTSEAQRIADMHKTKDNLEVAVIDEEKIFNEFSSGTPDATAYRRFMKMLWDKNPQKIKHLLLFGTGSYDNRNLAGSRSPYRLLTYQSNQSENETSSYTTDDYFTFLDDNLSSGISTLKMNIGVGRMTVSSPEEAKSIVDKLLEYVNSSSFGAWRNNGILLADEYDNFLYPYHAEGVQSLINETLGVKLHFNKIYVDNFPLEKGYISKVANSKTSELFKQGQLFASYMGHGSPAALSKTSFLWTKADVNNTEMENLPLFTLATCDVARFDSETHGVAEMLFLKRNGGAIACMASSRAVYATENDFLNRKFIEALFTQHDDGSFCTIGEAMMKAKNSFTNNSINKLNFIILGDPAMKLVYPLNRVKISSVGTQSPDNAIIYPQSKTIIKGYITNEKGENDINFSGKATISIYDASHKFGDLQENAYSTVRTSYICNDKLCEFSGDVVNGNFEIECIIPRQCQSINELATIDIYAYNPTSGYAVNETLKNVTLALYDQSKAIEDNTAPQITEMYINTPEFSNGDKINGSATLYATMSDNEAINSQSIAIGNSCQLIIDGNNSYSDISPYITYSDDNKSATIAFEIANLSEGRHSLELRACDIANNKTSSNITFYYTKSTINYDINVNETPARTKATFDLTTDNIENTEYKISVTDDNGKIIWAKTTSTFPIEWDLNDSLSQRVKPGIYNFSTTATSKNAQGYTTNKKIIVVKQ